MRFLLFKAFIYAIFALPFFTFHLANATLLTNDPHYSFEVLFTNPQCKEYVYTEEVLANNGDVLNSKPANAYCTHQDRVTSGHRQNAPQQRLVDWINKPDVASISLAFYSFSDSRILEELCKAITRGVHVRFIIDDKNQSNRAPNHLKNCGGEIIPRGHVSGVDLSHTKIILFKTKDEKILRIVFGSGNLSSGTVLHHENWNFAQTSTATYFAQDQLCAYEAMVAADSGASFRAHIKNCRVEIQNPPEDDIRSFFIPADNKEAINLFLDNLNKSNHLEIAAHRFSNKRILQSIKEKLVSNTLIQLILDDDVYWANRGFTVGPNTKSESAVINKLAIAGTQVQYVETNHYEKLLHHNKFVIFDNNAVWTGAGNLTNSGFSGNYENFYYITIPEVVKAFNDQYDYMWKNLSTPLARMPQRLSKPKLKEDLP